MSISIGDLKFSDSFKFMATSLQKLVENLYDKDDKFQDFNFMKKNSLIIMNYYLKKEYTPMTGLMIYQN